MSATNTFENQILQHIFNNTSIANIGDANGLPASAVAGNLYLGILTDASDLETGAVIEANYGGYARIPVARSAAGFTVSNNTVSNTAAITFNTAESGSNTANYFGIYTAATNGTLLIAGTISTPITITAGVKPEFGAGALTISID